MVSRREDYRFVTGLEGIRIDGGIMPKRSGDDVYVARGEDIAFAAEAVNEVSHVLDVGTSVLCDMTDTRIRADRLRRIVSALKSQMQPSATSFAANGTASVKRGISGSYDLMEMFGDIKISVGIKSDADNFSRGHIARLDDIKTLLDDTQLVIGSVSTSFRTGISPYDISHSESVQGEDPHYNPLYNVYVYHTVHEHEWATSYAVRYLTNGGAYTPRIKFSNDDGIPFGVRSYMVLNVQIDTETETSHESGGWYDLVPVDSSIGNLDQDGYRTLTIPAAPLASIGRAAVEAHGGSEHPYVPPEKTDEFKSQILVATPVAVFLQKLRGNHTLYA